MSNSLLTMSHLANIGLVVGLELGFSACEVESWLDAQTFELRLVLWFGAAEKMNKPRLRSPCEWASAYDSDANCIRDMRCVEIPYSMLQEPISKVQQQLTSDLLELIPSGPAGVRADMPLSLDL